jgi:CubicO group peptidase (beta-lactamase class C family)
MANGREKDRFDSHPARAIRALRTAVLLGGLLASCGELAGAPGATAEDWSWRTTTPEEARVSSDVLTRLSEIAEAGASDCLLVTRHGRIVGEGYWKATGRYHEREAYSVTKSVASTLVGIAQAQGRLDIEQRASDFITEWKGTPSEEITIRNLLSNDSGRYQTSDSDYRELTALQDDKTGYAIGLEQQHEIGTVWVYNNAAIQVLDAVLERATGMPTHEFARQYLFEPMGMTSRIVRDNVGNTLTFMGAQMSCRDMARFGLMHLHDGVWNGRQIVPAEWVAEATRPSTTLNPGYGYLWWIHPRSYSAQGAGGQLVVVVPEDGLVVTRLGDLRGPGFDQTTFLRLIREELALAE